MHPALALARRRSMRRESVAVVLRSSRIPAASPPPEVQHPILGSRPNSAVAGYFEPETTPSPSTSFRTGLGAPAPVVTSLLFLPTAAILVTGDEHGYITTWDVRGLVDHAVKRAHVERGATSSDAGSVTPAEGIGEARDTCGPPAEPRPIATWKGHTDEVLGLAEGFFAASADPDVGCAFVSTSNDRSGCVWSTDGVSLGNLAQGRIAGETVPGVAPYRADDPPKHAWAITFERQGKKRGGAQNPRKGRSFRKKAPETEPSGVKKPRDFAALLNSIEYDEDKRAKRPAGHAEPPAIVELVSTAAATPAPASATGPTGRRTGNSLRNVAFLEEPADVPDSGEDAGSPLSEDGKPVGLWNLDDAARRASMAFLTSIDTEPSERDDGTVFIPTHAFAGSAPDTPTSGMDGHFGLPSRVIKLGDVRKPKYRGPGGGRGDMNFSVGAPRGRLQGYLPAPPLAQTARGPARPTPAPVRAPSEIDFVRQGDTAAAQPALPPIRPPPKGDKPHVGGLSRATRRYLVTLGFDDNPGESTEQRSMRYHGKAVIGRGHVVGETEPSARVL